MPVCVLCFPSLCFLCRYYAAVIGDNKSHSLVSPFPLLLLSKPASSTWAAKLYCVCACMRACLHPRSHYPPGTWAWSRDQYIPQGGQSLWERTGFKKKLQCKSPGSIFKFNSPVNSHTTPYPKPTFTFSTKNPLNVTLRHLMTLIFSHCGVSFSLPWGVLFKFFILNRSIYLINLCLSVCQPLRHYVHSTVAVLLYLTVHSW